MAGEAAQARPKAAPGQSAPVAPLETELVRPLDSAKLQIGDEVVAKVRNVWMYGPCTLLHGALLHGVVRSLSSPTDKNGSVALDFRFPCANDDPHKLIWLALLAPYPEAQDATGQHVIQQYFHSSTFLKSGMPNNLGAGSNRAVMSSRENAAIPYITIGGGSEAAHVKRPTSVATGDVWKVPKAKLSVGTGPEGSTVVQSSGARVHLPRGAVLVLMPEELTSQHHVVEPEAVVAQKRKPPRVPGVGRCVAPACLHNFAALLSSAGATLRESIPLAKVGYRPSRFTSLDSLVYDTAVAFQDDSHLLFAFTLHALIPRVAGEEGDARARRVRAVLIDLNHNSPNRVADWYVPDRSQFLWPVAGEQIVVHEGDHLRWLTSDLHYQRSVDLGGPLAYFRAAPDGQHFAVGTIHEVHTKAEHVTLAGHVAPEEEVDIRILSSDLQLIDEGEGSSRAMPPELLNQGRVELRRQAEDEYYFRQYEWEAKGYHDFGLMTSSCLPRVSTGTPDLLVVTTCSQVGSKDHLAVIGTDGSPALEMTLSNKQLLPLQAGAHGDNGFALPVVTGGPEYIADAFATADLLSETVAVVRPGGGHPACGVALGSPGVSKQPVALSPSGTELATLDGGNLIVYSCPR